MAEGDDVNGGDGKTGAAGEVQQQLDTMREELGALKQETQTLKDAKVDLEQRLDEADKELLGEDFLDFKEGKSKSSTNNDGDKGGGTGTLDLDRASNREIAEHIERKYKGDIGAAVKDITSKIDANKQQLGMIAAQFDVALTTLKHNGSDGKTPFEENQEAIFKIAKENPKWGAEKCYQQFVIQSKVEADEKAADLKRKAEEDDATVTEKAGVPESTLTDKEVSAEEAAEIAYKGAFGNKE